MTITTAEWERAVAALRGERLLIACHMDPDADTLGSALALAQAVGLAGRGTAEVVVGTVDGRPASLPRRLGALPGAEDVVDPTRVAVPDTLVVVDCSGPDRLGSLAPLVDQAGQVVWIDHHRDGGARGDVLLVDPTAAATAELVADLVRRLGVPLEGSVATNLYAGLVTDTGRFGHSSTTPSAMRLGAELVAADVDVVGLTRLLFAEQRFSELTLLGAVLADARLDPRGLVWSVVDEEQLDAAGLAFGETDGLVDHLRTVSEADCALLLKRRRSGELKCSLRSINGVEVRSVAASFGGGGHDQAAGFTAHDDVEDVVERVAEAVAEAAGSRVTSTIRR